MALLRRFPLLRLAKHRKRCLLLRDAVPACCLCDQAAVTKPRRLVHHRIDARRILREDLLRRAQSLQKRVEVPILQGAQLKDCEA